MNNCLITFKIVDYNPKINSIPYQNYICLFICGDFKLKIPILNNNNYPNIKHQLNSIQTDINYKLSLFDVNKKELIGLGDLIIPYKLIQKTIPNNSLIYRKHIKFLLGMSTKIKLFGSLNKIGDICLQICVKIFKKTNKKISDDIKNNLFKNYIISNKSYKLSLTNKAQKNRKLLNPFYNINNNKKYTKKNNVTRNKINNDFIQDKSTESNKYIYVTDLSNTDLNTFSSIDDNSIENDKNFSNITNIINYNYYWLNSSSGKDGLKYTNSNKVNKRRNNNYDLNDLIEKRNIIKRKLIFSRNKSREITAKNRIPNINKSISGIRNLIKNNTDIINYKPKAKRELNSYKKVAINLSNSIYNYCEDSSDNFWLSKDDKSTNSKSIATRNKKNKSDNSNKIMLLSQTRDCKYYNKNKKPLANNMSSLMNDKFDVSLSIDDENDIIFKKNCFSNVINNSNINSNNNNNNNISFFRLKTGNIFRKKNYIKNKNKNKISNSIKSISKNKIKNNYNKSISHRFLQQKINNIVINKSFDNKKVNKKVTVNKIINNINYNVYQNKIKTFDMKILDFFNLNNIKIKSYKSQIKKNIKNLAYSQDLFLSTLKKSNRLEEKKSTCLINNFILGNIKNKMTEKIENRILNTKKLELKIYQKIFNASYYDYDIYLYRENKKKIDGKIMNIELSMIKNIINQYGNISHIYGDDMEKKQQLKNIFIKNGIQEKEEKDKNNFINVLTLSKINCSIEKIIKNTFNNNIKYKFNIIKEEDKESEKSNISYNDTRDEIMFIDKENESDDDNYYKLKNGLSFRNNNGNILKKYIKKKIKWN